MYKILLILPLILFSCGTESNQSKSPLVHRKEDVNKCERDFLFKYKSIYEYYIKMNKAEQDYDTISTEENRLKLISTSKDTCIACDSLYSQYPNMVCMASIKDGTVKKINPTEDGTENICALAKINCEI